MGGRKSPAANLCLLRIAPSSNTCSLRDDRVPCPHHAAICDDTGGKGWKVGHPQCRLNVSRVMDPHALALERVGEIHGESSTCGSRQEPQKLSAKNSRTGASRLSSTPAAALVPKPAPPPAILGALRYALSADPRDIAAPLQATPDLLRAIRDGEERIERVRALIARLEALGSDTSVAQRLPASLHNALEAMRYRANIRAASP
jgi:hypothetical protein